MLQIKQKYSLFPIQNHDYFISMYISVSSKPGRKTTTVQHKSQTSPTTERWRLWWYV